jgi:hypothetical protein
MVSSFSVLQGGRAVPLLAVMAPAVKAAGQKMGCQTQRAELIITSLSSGLRVFEGGFFLPDKAVKYAATGDNGVLCKRGMARRNRLKREGLNVTEHEHHE